MARQSPPMAQTPEGRRRTRQRIVFGLVIFAAIAISTIYTNFDLMNNSDVASSSSSSSITRVLPSALHHVHVPTYEEASEWAHHMLHPDHDDDDHHPTRSNGNNERSEEEEDNANGGEDGDADGGSDGANARVGEEEDDKGAGVGNGAAGASEAVERNSREDGNDEGGGGGGGGGGEGGGGSEGTGEEDKHRQQHETGVGGGGGGGGGGGDDTVSEDDAASSSSQPPDLRVGPDGKPEEEGGGGGGGGGGKAPDPALAAAYRQSISRARCMGAPADMMPTFVQQKGLRKKRSDTLPSRPGYVGVSHIEGISKGTVRARTENGPRRAKQESTSNPKVSSAETSLVSCLEDLSKCTHESRVAAWGLKGVREARVGRALPGVKRHKRCAVVGNSGGMLLKEYGSLIDKHDAVVRINVLENSKYFANLGRETTYRVLSYKMAKDVCCIMPPNKHPPDNKHMSYLVWFPAMRKQIVDRIKQRYKQPVIEMSGGFLNSAVGGFKTMRDELVRLGFGPFEDWEYMTSGMHAILAFSRSCETLDVYGFTTDVSAGPYWFTGRKVAPQSGRRQHSWDHERMILRLLHAAGHVNICA